MLKLEPYPTEDQGSCCQKYEPYDDQGNAAPHGAPNLPLPTRSGEGDTDFPGYSGFSPGDAKGALPKG